MAAGAVSVTRAASPWVFFTADEAALVDELCEQIVPGDQDPGARRAGVVRYIDRQLAGPLKRFAKTYREGLPALDQECVRATGQRFLDLEFTQQTKFLKSIEEGSNRTLSTFFNIVIDHTMQGFYGDPKHGGNAGGASWKMLGIEHVMAGHVKS